MKQYLLFEIVTVINFITFPQTVSFLSAKLTYENSTFPANDYILASTYINIPIAENDCNILQLKIDGKSHKFCLQTCKISENGIVNSKTKLIVQETNSNRMFDIHELDLKFVKGYDLSKPYSSFVSGYMKKGRFYGKIDLGGKAFYVESVHNFPFLLKRHNLNPDNLNAVIYEDGSVSNKNILDQNRDSIKIQYFKATESNEAKGKVCPLMILIDYSFLHVISKDDMNCAILTVLHSVYEANSIFRSSDFNNDGVPDNIGFVVKYLIVIRTPRTEIIHLPAYTKQPIDGKLYLFKLSRHELLREVCLGVAFTAQPFLYRALGLSYTAIQQASNLLKPSVGGLCERPSRIGYGESYNNLAITYCLENGMRVPQVTSDLSLAHELGHSFGSDHDESPDCYGYLMSPHTFNGTFRKNFVFSSCSKRQISAVLKNKGYCLENDNNSFCGNGIIEKGEECDCGLYIDCMERDPCCIPRRSKGPACTVNKEDGHQCHPSQGFCCLPNCKYRDVSEIGLSCEYFDKKCPCKNENSCTCGVLGECLKDECHSRECTRIGSRECPCPKDQNEQCLICCLDFDGTCVPSSSLTEKFVKKNATLIADLKRYGARNGTNEIVKSFCYRKNCVQLGFHTFAADNFCVYQAKLGVCSAHHTCEVPSTVTSIFPSIGKITARSASRGISFPSLFLLLLFVVCTMSV